MIHDTYDMNNIPDDDSVNVVVKALHNIANLCALGTIAQKMTPIQREFLAAEALLTASELSASGNTSITDTYNRGLEIIEKAKENTLS